MDGAFEWVATAFPMERAVPAAIMVLLFCFLASGWRTILAFTLIAILVDPLLPAIGAVVTGGLPADAGAWLGENYIIDDVGLWALRALVYWVAIGVATTARRDMTRHYDPNKTESAPVIH